ncbi:Uncharacterised protein [Pandoraea pnomenusa]|uniref:Uncharacterized protein n=1 Tax=Pandoraea pnomenusa TaxID=93220 RepID=A0A379KDC5_9BURK|nr:Uncharacterised protein [Pandoraea pnomenusa]
MRKTCASLFPRGIRVHVVSISLTDPEKAIVDAFASEAFPGQVLAFTYAGRVLVRTALALRDRNPNLFANVIADIKSRDDQQHARSVEGR